MSNVLQKSKSAYNVSLLLLKIEHLFFQESIYNNKSIGVTIYRCQIQAFINKRKTFEVFKLIYFKKLPIKKVFLQFFFTISKLLKKYYYTVNYIFHVKDQKKIDFLCQKYNFKALM